MYDFNDIVPLEQVLQDLVDKGVLEQDCDHPRADIEVEEDKAYCLTCGKLISYEEGIERGIWLDDDRGFDEERENAQDL